MVFSDMGTPHDQLRRISGPDLHERTLRLVGEERRVSVEVLWHLKEISERWLYLEMGYPSLWAYCTQALKYSSGAAYRRISAMRALRQETTFVAECLESGELTLTTVAQIESFCSKTETETGKASQSESGGAAIPDKKALLKAAAQKSSREVERMLANLNPEACEKRSDQVRAIGVDQSEVRFMASGELLDKLERVKDLCAHAIGSPNPSYADLFHFMADRVLKQIVVKPKTKVKAQMETTKEEQSQSQLQVQEQVRTAVVAAVAAAHLQAGEQQRFRSSAGASPSTSAPEVETDTNASMTAERTTKRDSAATITAAAAAAVATAAKELSNDDLRRYIPAPFDAKYFTKQGFSVNTLIQRPSVVARKGACLRSIIFSPLLLVARRLIQATLGLFVVHITSGFPEKHLGQKKSMRSSDFEKRKTPSRWKHSLLCRFADPSRH